MDGAVFGGGGGVGLTASIQSIWAEAGVSAAQTSADARSMDGTTRMWSPRKSRTTITQNARVATVWLSLILTPF